MKVIAKIANYTPCVLSPVPTDREIRSHGGGSFPSASFIVGGETFDPERGVAAEKRPELGHEEAVNITSFQRRVKCPERAGAIVRPEIVAELGAGAFCACLRELRRSLVSSSLPSDCRRDAFSRDKTTRYYELVMYNQVRV